MCRAQIIPLLALTLALGVESPRLSYGQWRVDGASLCAATGPQNYPKIVSDGTGGAIVTWEDGRPGPSGDIYAQRVDAAGVPQWTADGVALCKASGNQDYPTIVSDGAGGAIVCWQDHRNGANWAIYAQRVSAAGVPQWDPDGVALCAVANAQTGPRMVPDGAGGAIVTWDDLRAATWDVYAQRVDAAGAPQWAAAGVPICTTAGHQKRPSITLDDAGSAIITWYDGRNSATSWDVYAQRVDGTGAPIWTADGVPLCTAPNGQFNGGILADGAGGAIVTWGDYRSANSDVYAQHVLASGVVDPSWTPNGVPMCIAGGDQQVPTIVPDGAGGAIVTWEDYRNGSYADIYAQHLLVSGGTDPAWTANGVSLCTAADDQSSPQMVSDGAGGAIVTWYDYRDLSTHIYAQRVNATGAPQWTANGVPVCTATSDQDFPTIASDGAGGAIIAWEDYRNGGSDIYVQRVYGAGGVAAVPPQGPSHFAVYAPYPNPAHAASTISFDLPTAQPVVVSIYDVTGQIVRTLAGGGELPAGTHSLVWNGASDSGAPVRAGVYFIRVSATSAVETRRVAFLR